jgi:hypothetical protein
VKQWENPLQFYYYFISKVFTMKREDLLQNKTKETKLAALYWAKLVIVTTPCKNLHAHFSSCKIVM